MFINRSGTMVLFFLPLYLTQKLKMTPFESGQLISLYGVGALCAPFLGGWLSDRIGPFLVQFLSLAGGGTLFILLGRTEDPFWFAVTLLILGLVNESFRPANAIVISKFCTAENRSRGFGLNRMAINLGMAIGPAFGGFLATKDYAYLFWADGITCGIAALLVLFFLFRFGLGKPETVSISRTTVEKKIKRSPWEDHLFLSFLLFLFLGTLVFGQLSNTWPLYLKEYCFLKESHIGFLLTINATLIVLFEMPLIYRIEKRSVLKMIGLGIAFLAGGFALLPLGNSYLFLMFTVVVWTIGESVAFPLSASFAASCAKEENPGKYLGVFHLAFAMSSVLAPIFGMWVYENLGPNWLWMGSGVLGLLMWMSFWKLENYLVSIRVRG